MIEVIKELSPDSILLSGVIIIMTYIVRGALWVTAKACKILTEKLFETLAAVNTIEQQMKSILSLTGDVQKLKTDLDSAWHEIRKIKSAKSS